jgi:hypothetical protein
MKKTTLFLVVTILSICATNLQAELPVKGMLTNKLYDGQGKPDSLIFTKNIGKPDSITYTQTAEGLNLNVRSVNFSPILWSLPASKGFAISGPYTVEAKVAVNKSTTNGFILEMQGVVGKRVQIGIDTNSVYNMTYYPSVVKEVIATNLNNKLMHTYRVAVDATDKAYIYRDSEPIGLIDVDGAISSRAAYKGVESILKDSVIETLNSFATPPHPAKKYDNEGGFLFALSTDADITYSSWATMGIDTIKANVKAGASSLWGTNGTSGHVWIKKLVTNPGRYRLSYWSKTRLAYHKYTGSIKLLSTDTVTLIASNTMINGNLAYNFKQYVFDVTKEGTIVVDLINNPTAACHFWIDDLKLERVENESYVCFGKDNEIGDEDFTMGGFAYDMSGAYAPDANSGVYTIKGNTANIIVSQNGSKSMNVSYELTQNETIGLQLIDMTGRIIKTQHIESYVGRNSFTIQTPTNGIYLLKLTSKASTIAVKFAVK